MTTLLKGGTVVTARDILAADVLIEGERIAALGVDLPKAGAEVIDVTGKILLPGGIDVHTHLDMPLGDISSSDDFYTGHVAAAFGGTTTHLDFCNQAPGQTLRAALDDWHARARDKAVIDYGFHVTLTDIDDAILDEIATLPAQGVTTIKMLTAYKGRIMVRDDELFLAMERARDAGLLTMVHCENGDVIDILVRRAVATGRISPRFHPLTRPAVLEAEATNRVIALAELANAPLYVVHITCRASLSAFAAARARGVRVWGETCLQYLFFTHHDLDRPDFEGAKWVCSPPFREIEDQEALWRALADGSLDVVSTDHCPFYFGSQKTLGRYDFSQIPNGVPGIEDRLPVLHHAGVNGGRFDLCRFVELTATTPARLFGLAGRKGAIAPGHDADIAVWDPGTHRTISVSNSHSAVDYNLYEGMELIGVPQQVYRRGQLIVDHDQFLGESGTGHYLFRECV